MGNPKQKWTADEEEALRAGVAKHGTGKWKNILTDLEFSPFLYSRSNIDLKDKWRNMSVSANGQGPREKSRTPKIKANPDAPLATPVPLNAVGPASGPVVVYEQPADVVMDDPSKCALDGKTASKYNSMIYEALSNLNDPNGSDTSAIVSFVEARYEVPPNIRRLLSSRLRRLVVQQKLEKTENGYRIKKDFLSLKSPNPNPNPNPNANSNPNPNPVPNPNPMPKPKDIRAKQPQTSSAYHLGDTVEEAAVSAAYKIADAENKSFVAAEAVKEAERISRMAEDTDALLQLAKEIFEKCSHGEIVMML